MTDPFGFLDAVFGDDGSGGSSAQGSPPLHQGFAPLAGWMVGQAFAGAGPVGQYLGMMYGSPGTGIPSVDWGEEYADASQSRDDANRADYSGSSRTEEDTSPSESTPVVDTSPPSPPTEGRTLDVLDRADNGSAAPQSPVEEVWVFGSPPDRPRSTDSFEDFLNSQRGTRFSGQEITIRLGPPLMRPPRPPRPPRPRPPAVRKPVPPDPTAPQEPPAETPPADGGPYFLVDTTPSTVPGSDVPIVPWMSDAAVPDDFLPWGSWERPEKLPTPRWERGETGRLENVPTVPTERTFWDRGGTGLAAGAVTAAVGLAVLFWWNPVGWVAGASAALAIAGGLAATTASAVELSASYGGASTAQQDAEMNRAVGAALGYTSVGGVLGGVAGTVLADDPMVGFEEGMFWGGLGEAATGLPGAVRAVPALWHAAVPWGKSLLLTPFWFLMSAGGGGGNQRALARVFAAQRRIAPRVVRVQYLGTTRLLERDADWARFQVDATKSRDEAIFRITYANGQEKIVLADRFLMRNRTILEAKFGTLGQMWDPVHEARIMGQVNRYLEITSCQGGRVGYMVSTELGAERLTQRFTADFPTQMQSGQLWVEWVPWRR